MNHWFYRFNINRLNLIILILSFQPPWLPRFVCLPFIVKLGTSYFPFDQKYGELIVVNFFPFILFSSPDPKGHVSYCHHWASVCLSITFSHFNQLLWSHRANLNQTLVEWSLDGPLPNLCPVIPTSNLDGHQAKNRKKGGWNFNCPLLL
jgi:hypothetical protein